MLSQSVSGTSSMGPTQAIANGPCVFAEDTVRQGTQDVAGAAQGTADSAADSASAVAQKASNTASSAANDASNKVSAGRKNVCCCVKCSVDAKQISQNTDSGLLTKSVLRPSDWLPTG